MNALFYSAWVASHSDPVSKAYYDPKRAEDKRHNAAVICLAKRSCNVFFGMPIKADTMSAVKKSPEPPVSEKVT